MIDLHGHYLPGVDDGPESMAMALEMLRMAENDGIEAVVATPHTLSNFSLVKDFHELKQIYVQVKSRAREEGLNIRILPGAENFFDSRLTEYLRNHPNVLTIADSDFFLLEFPPDFVFPGTRQFIYQVMSEGFIPIIAHPERNREFRRNPNLLYELMQMGALSQVTAASFRGDFGMDVRNAAQEFLKFNLISVIATDAHRPDFRKPQMAFIYDILPESGREIIDMLVDKIPRAIIENEVPPEIGPPREPNRKASVVDFFKGLFQHE